MAGVGINQAKVVFEIPFPMITRGLLADINVSNAVWICDGGQTEINGSGDLGVHLNQDEKKLLLDNQQKCVHQKLKNRGVFFKSHPVSKIDLSISICLKFSEKDSQNGS